MFHDPNMITSMNVPVARLGLAGQTLPSGVRFSRATELNNLSICWDAASLCTEVLQVIVARDYTGNRTVGGFRWATFGCKHDAHLLLGCNVC